MDTYEYLKLLEQAVNGNLVAQILLRCEDEFEYDEDEE